MKLLVGLLVLTALSVVGGVEETSTSQNEPRLPSWHRVIHSRCPMASELGRGGGTRSSPGLVS